MFCKTVLFLLTNWPVGTVKVIVGSSSKAFFHPIFDGFETIAYNYFATKNHNFATNDNFCATKRKNKMEGLFCWKIWFFAFSSIEIFEAKQLFCNKIQLICNI